MGTPSSASASSADCLANTSSKRHDSSGDRPIANACSTRSAASLSETYEELKELRGELETIQIEGDRLPKPMLDATGVESSVKS